MTRRRTHQRKLRYPPTTDSCVYGHHLNPATRNHLSQCRVCVSTYVTAWWDSHPIARQCNNRGIPASLPANLPPLTAQWLLS